MTVDFNLDAAQRQILASVQDVLADQFSLARFRIARGGDHDRSALAEVAALGWFGLGVPEEAGGAGLPLVDEMILFRELGRHLATPSILAASLGVHVALALGNASLATDIMGGRARVCLANALTGRAVGRVRLAIYDGADADYLLFWDAASFSLLPFHCVGESQRGRCLDRTVSLMHADVVSDGASTLTAAAAQALRIRADLLVSAQLLGLAEAALDVAVDYAKLRRQFGQAIGSFQAIKHRCADMKVRVKPLAALVTMAGLAVQEGHRDAALQVASARLLAARYAIENASAGIQIHGAMGFTAECDAHLFLLRSHMLEHIGGTITEREAEIASLPA
jgi:alkylation response protein AidB-like acyl-CoA dehydrogenase